MPTGIVTDGFIRSWMCLPAMRLSTLSDASVAGRQQQLLQELPNLLPSTIAKHSSSSSSRATGAPFRVPWCFIPATHCLQGCLRAAHFAEDKVKRMGGLWFLCGRAAVTNEKSSIWRKTRIVNPVSMSSRWNTSLQPWGS
ncbi:hypothetical protein ABBQ38_007925 [Trebouxia sp. C0009 RCD-2024]